MKALVMAATSLMVSPGFFDRADARGSAGSVSRGGGQSMIRKMQRKDRYRPRVQLVSPRQDMRTGDGVIPLVIDYVVQVGHVGAVDVYVDGRKAATYPVAGRQRKGRMEVTLDLGRYGPGTHTLRIGGRQGLPGKQSLGRVNLGSVKVMVVR